MHGLLSSHALISRAQARNPKLRTGRLSARACSARADLAILHTVSQTTSFAATPSNTTAIARLRVVSGNRPAIRVPA